MKALQRSVDVPSSLPTTLLAGSALGSRSANVAIECPKCAKRSIVKRSPNTFDCLNCDFHKELPPLAASGLRSPMSLNVGLPASLSQKGMGLATNPGQLQLESMYRDEEPDKTHPLIFAALAVLFGIVLL